jgi:hypothetical protein
MSDEQTDKIKIYYENGTVYLRNDTRSDTFSSSWSKVSLRYPHIRATDFVYGADSNATDAYIRNGTEVVRFTGTVGNDSVEAANLVVCIDERGVVRSGNMTFSDWYVEQEQYTIYRYQLDILEIGSTSIRQPTWVTQMSD